MGVRLDLERVERAPPGWSDPAGRAGAALAYDPTSRKMIMFGGRAADYSPFNDTWLYDPGENQWTEMKPRKAAPSPRSFPSPVFDEGTGQLLLMGGDRVLRSLDVYAHDSNASIWEPLFSPASPPTGNGQATQFDPLTRRLLMFGGFGKMGALGDTWAYDSATRTWLELKLTTAPSRRFGAAAAYDLNAHQMILFGGAKEVKPKGGGLEGGQETMDDTWVLVPA